MRCCYHDLKAVAAAAAAVPPQDEKEADDEEEEAATTTVPTRCMASIAPANGIIPLTKLWGMSPSPHTTIGIYNDSFVWIPHVSSQ